MFSFFRRKDKAVRYFLGGLLVLICVTMVITLIPGMTGSGTADDTVVAQVGGDKIMSSELRRQLQMMSRDNRIPASVLPLYAPTLVSQMVEQHTVLFEAKRLGLGISSEELAAAVRAIPGLFPNGQFVGYDQYRQMVEQRYGFSVPEFEQQFERMLITEKLRRMVTAGVFVNDAEVLHEYHHRNDKTTIKYVVMKSSDLSSKVQLSDADVSDYFQKHRNQYELPEQRQFRLVFVDTSKVKDNVQVTDDDLRRFYNENRDRFRVEDRVKVSHILFKTLGKNASETEDIRKKAEDVLQKLRGGADFGQMAKQYSDDAGSTAKGGDLGWLVRGQAAAEVEKTAFSLDPGKLSGVVQTAAGFEIIRVDDRQRAHLQTLAEVKDQILPEVKAIKAQREVEAQARKIDDAVRKSKGDLPALASQLGVSIVDTGMIKRGDSVAAAGSSTALDDALFAATLKPKQTTEAVQLTNGVVVAQLVSISPAHPAELAEVRDRVENDARNEKTQQTLKTKVQQLADQGRKEGLDKAASSLGLKVQTSEPFTSEGTIKDVGSAATLALDNLKVGDVGGPVPAGDGQVVFAVEGREPAEEAQLATQKENIRNELQQMKAMDMYQVFMDSVRKQLEKEGKLSINDAAIQKVASSFGQ